VEKEVTLYLLLWKTQDFEMFPVAKKYRLCVVSILFWFLLFYGIDHYRSWNERIYDFSPQILNNYCAEECVMM